MERSMNHEKRRWVTNDGIVEEEHEKKKKTKKAKVGKRVKVVLRCEQSETRSVEKWKEENEAKVQNREKVTARCLCIASHRITLIPWDRCPNESSASSRTATISVSFS